MPRVCLYLHDALVHMHVRRVFAYSRLELHCMDLISTGTCACACMPRVRHVCMYIHTRIHMYACTFACMYVCVCVFETRSHDYMHARARSHTHAYPRVYTHVSSSSYDTHVSSSSSDTHVLDPVSLTECVPSNEASPNGSHLTSLAQTLAHAPDVFCGRNLLAARVRLRRLMILPFGVASRQRWHATIIFCTGCSWQSLLARLSSSRSASSMRSVMSW